MMPEFSYLKYIRVYGTAEDPEECFQGLGASSVYGGSAPGVDGSDGSDGSDGGTDTESLPEALWTGQNAIIDAEIDYLTQLQIDFKQRKRETEQHKSQLLDFFEEMIGDALGALVGGVVASQVPALGPLASFLTDFGIGMLFDELALWLTEGNAMFDGLIAEDHAIMDLEMSVSNYDHRQGVLSRHAQQISTILEQITLAEAGLRQGTTVQGSDLAEYFKTAFLREDEDGILQGFMETRLKDLAYNEEILEEPGSGVRIILRGRSHAVEYQG